MRTTTKVTVLIPPAVPPGEPPMTISRIRMNLPASDRLAISTLLNPAVRAVTGRPALFRMTGGFTDLHFLTEAGVPTVGYGVAGGDGHGDNEFVRLDGLLTAARVYARMALNPVGS